VFFKRSLPMLRAALVACPIVLFGVISCGDSSSDVTSGNAGTAGTSANAGESPGGGPAETAGTTSTGNTTSGGGTTSNTGGAETTSGGASEGGMSTTTGGAPESMAGAATAGGAGGAASANCPDIFGTYTIKTRAGMCGSLDKNAPQSIQGNDVTCFAHFVSIPLKVGDPAAINGGTLVDTKGDFTKAKLTLDKTVSTPCMGSWNEMNQTMTIKCGDPGSLCTITLMKQ
jgi:hypothetical protein